MAHGIGLTLDNGPGVQYLLLTDRGYEVDLYVMVRVVQDDLAGTHRIYNDRINMLAGDFPTNYWITADKDCAILTIQRGVTYDRIWMGMVTAFAPGLHAPGYTPYKLCVVHQIGPVSGHRL